MKADGRRTSLRLTKSSSVIQEVLERAATNSQHHRIGRKALRTQQGMPTVQASPTLSETKPFRQFYQFNKPARAALCPSLPRAQFTPFNNLRPSCLRQSVSSHAFLPEAATAAPETKVPSRRQQRRHFSHNDRNSATYLRVPVALSSAI